MATERARRRTWTLAVALALTLAVLYATTGVASGLRSGANLVVTPFSWAVNVIARPIGHFFAGTINYSDVVSQNQKLRYQLGRADERLNEQWSYARQLQELSQADDVPFVGSLTRVVAEVTSLSPTNFAVTLDIDKGRDEGVLVGMPVVANGGLVGRVIATTSAGATVRLISDTASSVGVTYGTGTTTFIVSGRGLDQGLEANSVPLSAKLGPGTKLSTDALNGELYPPGIPVATVKTVNLTPGAASYNLTLVPAANLRQLTYLDVVLWEPQS